MATTTTKATVAAPTDRAPGVAYQTYNSNGTVKQAYTADQYHATFGGSSGGTATNPDTPTGVGGKIDMKTGQITSGPMAGKSGAINTAPVPPTPLAPGAAATQTNNGTSAGTPTVPYEQAAANLAKGGLKGTELANAQAGLANKYNVTHDNLTSSGTPPPANASDARNIISSALPNTQATTESPGATAALASDPIQQLTKLATDYFSPDNQKTSLLDQYKQMYKEEGIGNLDEQILNASRIINGTEDDIRSEIQAAGGFGTNSQVMAMADARNKVLLQNYNALVQQKQTAEAHLNTMIGLAGQDRAYAQQQFTDKLNVLGQLNTFQQQATNNIREGFNNLVSQVGMAGAYAAYKNSPQQLATIEKVMGVAPGGLATLSTYTKPLTELEKADLEYKKAEAAKLRSEVTAANAPPDPSQTIAYAQQYAATGQIPTGLPKGTFGAVSQYAKELPKPDGTLVSNATGVAPSNLSSAQMDGIVALRDLQQKLDDAKVLYQSYYHGVLPGIKNAVFPSQGEKQYQDLKGEIVDLLARARSGAALSANEEKNYAAKLPGDFNKAFFLGAGGTQSIDDLKSSLSNKLDTTLSTHNVSIYGYTKVDLQGEKYTVGQIVNSPDGKTGRVNADGSITILTQ